MNSKIIFHFIYTKYFRTTADVWLLLLLINRKMMNILRAKHSGILTCMSVHCIRYPRQVLFSRPFDENNKKKKEKKIIMDEDDDDQETKLKHNSIVTTIDTGIPCNGQLFNLISEIELKNHPQFTYSCHLLCLFSSMSSSSSLFSFLHWIQFIWVYIQYICHIARPLGYDFKHMTNECKKRPLKTYNELRTNRKEWHFKIYLLCKRRNENRRRRE